MECFGTTDFDNNSQLITLSVIIISGLHCTLFTYLLTPCSKVLLEKLTRFQLVKKFPAFYGTPRFITAVTSARHLSLSWANSTNSIPQHPTTWKSIFFYFPSIYIWVSQVVSFSQVSPPKPCISLSSPPYELHAPPISFNKKVNTIKM